MLVPSTIKAWLALSLLVCATACGGANANAELTTVKLPAHLSDENVAEAQREYWKLKADHPDRKRVRGLLASYYAADARDVIHADDYDGVIERFANVARLHTPEDFDAHDLATEIRPLAQFLRTKAAERGDESVTLSALLVLQTVGDDTEKAEKEYQEIDAWGRRARSMMDSKLESLTKLIEVWEEHATLTPAPEVLARVAKLHIERRDALLAQMKSGDANQFSRQDLFTAPAILQQAPLAVAAIFLEHGDVASARTYVKSMGDNGGVERELLRVLEAAQNGDDAALLELAMTFARGRAETSLGICRHGYQRHPKEVGFPQCLARISAEANEWPMATAWFRETVRLAPTRREAYDEALAQIREFIERSPADTNPATARGMVKQADEIIAERERRWPKTSGEIELERFHIAVGQMELNAGDIEAARRRFEASLQVKETADADENLGRIASANGAYPDAVGFFEKALALSNPKADLTATFAKAELLLRLGDSKRAMHDDAGSSAAYGQAVKMLTAAEAQANSFGKVEIEMRMGILLDRQGRSKDGAKSFRDAIRDAENLRSSMGDRETFPASAALQQTYARILSHLASAPEPNLDLAQDIFRAAQRQLTLDPEWKVYFALWTKLIAARSGKSPDDEVRIVLDQHKHSTEWYGALARFGVGELTYQGLLALADDPGQQTEAHFYEATPAMLRGGGAEVDRQLGLALKNKMLNFYEFIMAEELTRIRTRHPESSAAAPESAPKAPPKSKAAPKK